MSTQTKLNIYTAAETLKRLENGVLELPTKLPIFDNAPSPFFKGWSHLLAGAPKAGKTAIMSHWVTRWCATQEVFYITEEPESIWAMRFKAGQQFNRENLAVAYAMGSKRDHITSAVATRARGNIVIIDTLRLLGIEDENSAAAAEGAMTPIITAARTSDATLIFMHHTRKASGSYGHAIAGTHAIMGIVDVGLELNRAESRPNVRTLSGWGRIDEVVPVTYEKMGDDFIPTDQVLEAAQAELLVQIGLNSSPD